MNEIFRQILAALAGAIFLAVFSMFTDFVFWFNVCVSAGIGLGTYFTIPRQKEPHEIEIAPGVYQVDLDKAVAQLDEFQKKFESLAAKCRQPKLVAMLGAITATLNKISVNFQEDPRDLKNADLFLSQYLPNAFDLAAKSVRLADVYAGGDERGNPDSAQETLQQIHNGLKDFYQQCLQNDLIDMEVNAEMLKSITDMDLNNLGK